MKLFWLLIFISTSSFGFTLNNNFGASFSKNRVKVMVAGQTNCPGASMTVYDLVDLIKPAVSEFWNRVPTSKLRLIPAGFTGTITNINSGKLCSPTDAACITAAAGNLIPPVDEIIIACNDEATNFGNDVLAVTIPNNFRGKKIKGAVVLLNDVAQFGNLSRSDKIGVIAHEIGHAIGLGHSPDDAALMYYRVTDLRKRLGRDDMKGVSYLYPIKLDGCGLIGSTSTPNKIDPQLWQLVIGFALIMLVMKILKMLKLFNRPKARSTL